MSERTYYSREAEIRANQERTVMSLVILAAGLGIGVLLALLFATDAGMKARRDVAEAIEQGIEGGQEGVSTTLKRLEKEFDELRKRVEDRLGR